MDRNENDQVWDKGSIQKCFLCREGEITLNSFMEKAGFSLDLKEQSWGGGPSRSTDWTGRKHRGGWGTERKRLWPEQGVQLRPGRGERNSPAWWTPVAGRSNPNFTTVELCDPGVVPSPRRVLAPPSANGRFCETM